MSVSGRAPRGAVWARPGKTRLRQNVGAFLGLCVRRRHIIRPGLFWPVSGRAVVWAVGATVVLAATMVLLDAWAITRARQLPGWLVRLFDEITDYGKSGWLLWPLAILLVGTSVAGARTLSRRTSVLLTAIALRLFFLFCAIGIPGLAVAIVKRIIGRARPFVDGPADPFAYAWPVWRSEYASLPSGHSTTAFAAAFAFGALWPKARPFLWSYAAMIALSRVVVTAHHPSDVVAGAVAGVIGAVLVRDWFAARRLVFAIGGDGVVRALPGPSWRRIKRVARAVVRP